MKEQEYEYEGHRQGFKTNFLETVIYNNEILIYSKQLDFSSTGLFVFGTSFQNLCLKCCSVTYLKLPSNCFFFSGTDEFYVD